ncbi:glyoxalase domain-containing protein 4 [Exaiptasia diaphana]|uniref:VOC domain-containing protein n=1 Tax=Exaiptasia diaphana TaxID=2652724 RepID=A0A913Y5P7_EXADI|nr:glyoxalase domain-containing protein 4 [Exaiptasia diaphana]KXJ29028.1 Glyoxalase domain-containing protein 4 [Exaiptasia diaphana]
MSSRRALHFVFKIGNRHESAKFYRSILGMKTLRHEEFEEGCKATCNGPYDGKWSKTMIGYGSEDDHFVLELTYNYTVKEYKRGNDFQSITIFSKNAVANAKKFGYPMTDKGDGQYLIQAPDGYPFVLFDKDSGDPVQKVALGVSNLKNSLDYWHKLLGMTIVNQEDNSATLCYDTNKVKLELVQVDGKVDRGTAFGRIAFSCPKIEQEGIQSSVQNAGHTILTPLVTLDTPGKATVRVVILSDPDGHEICFVEDEGFRELSQFDPQGDKLLDEGLEKDKSEEWFAKKKAKKN